MIIENKLLSQMIAKEVFLCQMREGDCWCPHTREERPPHMDFTGSVHLGIKNYSEKLSSAWEIVEEMGRKGYILSLVQNVQNHWVAEFKHPNVFSEIAAVQSQTASRAICLAALMALGIRF